MRNHLADVTVTVTMSQPNTDVRHVLATNYLHNGGFNVNANGWEPSYGAGSVAMNWGWLTTTGNGSNRAFAVRTTNTTWAVQPGETVYCRALVRMFSGQTPTGCVGRFSFGGSLVTVDPEGWNPQGLDGWHSLRFTATVPTNYTGGSCHVIVGAWLPSTTTSNDVMHVDSVIVSDEDRAFFDGHTPALSPNHYRWTGTPDNSPSEHYVTGELLTVNTTDADAAFLGDLPSAVRTMTGQWQQASGRDHPTPGKLTLELILDTPAHPAVDYESEVVVMLTIAGREPFMFWRGWIDDIEINRRVVHHPETRAETVRWEWSIAAGDVLARAAATKINIPPMPAEPVFTIHAAGGIGRLEKIKNAIPFALLSEGMWNGTGGFMGLQPEFDGDYITSVRARDVDNTDVLSILQDTANAGAMLVVEAEDGVTLRHGPGTRRLFFNELRTNYFDSPTYPDENHHWAADVWSGPGSMEYDDTPQALRLDNVYEVGSEAIVETSRRIDRSTLLNEVSIGFYTGTAAEPTGRTHYERNTTRQSSTSQHRMASDWYAVSSSARPPLMVAAARSWLAETERPTRSISQTSVLTDKLPADVLEAFVRVNRRNAAGIAILGEPADLPVSWRPIIGTATIEAGKIALDLTLEPASLAGQSPLTFAEIPGPATATFDDGTPVVVDATFAQVDVGVDFPTFGGMWLVNKSAYGLYFRTVNR